MRVHEASPPTSFPVASGFTSSISVGSSFGVRELLIRFETGRLLTGILETGLMAAHRQ